VEAVSSVRKSHAPIAVAGASAVAAPNEFFAILRCYLPEAESCLKTVNAQLRSGPPYVDDTGSRSWWAF
jgi:hypothetical protein